MSETLRGIEPARDLGHYVSRVGAWASQGVNCVFLLGHPDQSLSARCYLQRNGRVWCALYRAINALFWWDNDHCKASHERDLRFARRLLELSNTTETL